MRIPASSATYAYVESSALGGTILQIVLDSSGALSSEQAQTYITKGDTAKAFTIDPTGKFAYLADSVTTSTGGTVYGFTVGTAGALTPIAGSQSLLGSPSAIAVDPSGKYLFVLNSSAQISAIYGQGNGAVTEFSIGADGTLTVMDTLFIPTGDQPVAMMIDTTSSNLYVVNQAVGQSVSDTFGGTITEYALGANGAITHTAKATVSQPMTQAGVLDSTGSHLYTTARSISGNSADGVIEYAISGGVVNQTPVATSTLGVGANPLSVSLDSTGKYAYILNGNGTIAEFSVGANGVLTAMAVPAVTTNANPSLLLVDPSNKYVYVGDSKGGVTQFPVSKSHWWEGVRIGKYPKAYKLSKNVTAWLCSDIDFLIQSYEQQNVEGKK